MAELVNYCYPEEDAEKLAKITNGLTLDHMGIFLPMSWEQVKGIMSGAVSQITDVEEADSVLVRRRLAKRADCEPTVAIHYVSFSSTRLPRLELFTLEGTERPIPFEKRLAEFENGFEIHLAFRVPETLEKATIERLNILNLTPAMEGKHLFTGETTRYYQLGGQFNRHFELLFSAPRLPSIQSA